ncbi:MAG: fibronectin type III domain-containing protein [Phycisphaeraceae bacterium]|nr:fibronectin type III domain-containing protein [Phycisphaeraceae bacterium]
MTWTQPNCAHLRRITSPLLLGVAISALLFSITACASVQRDGFVEHRRAERPLGLYLTWQRDPTTTMTIDWHTPPVKGTTAAYRPVLRYKAVGDEAWRTVRGESIPFPHSDRTIHRVELTGLEPGAEYRFQLERFARPFSFKTVPAELTEPLVFATGGDTRHDQEWMERTNSVAMRYEPSFIVWGGDLAYADGRPDRIGRWYEWFDAIMNTLITEEGRVIPIIVGIGNHEIRGGYIHRHEDYEQTDAFRRRIAPFFYGLFAFPGQPGYGVLDFGDYLSVVILDTDHSNPVDGVQTRWLEEVLERRAARPHVFPVYHVPAYPSHRDMEGHVESRVRELWTPLFDRYNIRLAFENHDHTYKRTVPIRDGRRHDDGVVYIGDGAWGVRTREGDNRDAWYIEQFASERHALIVTLHGENRHVLAVSEDGDVLDEYGQRP